MVQENRSQLAFRQGEGTGVVERILCGDDEEGLGKLVGASIQGDLSLHHGLKHGALGLGTDAIQLIQQQNMAEHRTGLKPETLFLRIPEVDAQQVRGQQVVGALDALEAAAEDAGQPFGQGGLSHPRKILQQYMAAGQHGCEGPPHLGLLAHYHGLEGGEPSPCRRPDPL